MCHPLRLHHLHFCSLLCFCYLRFRGPLCFHDLHFCSLLRFRHLHFCFLLRRCYLFFCSLLNLKGLHLHLPAFTFKPKFSIFSFLFCGFTKRCFLCKLCLSIKLCLCHFFYNHLADFYIWNIVVIHNLFFYLFDKLWSYHFMLLYGNFFQIAGIPFYKTLEYGVIRDKVGIHLNQILFIELQRGISFFNRITDLIIALKELPQLITRAVIRILHHQVGTLNWTAYFGTACHQTTEGAVPKCHDQTSDTVDSHEDLHIVAVILCKTLPVLNLHLNLIFDFFISIIDLALHLERVADLIAGRPEDDIRSFIDESHKPLNQMVNEPVLIQIIAFLCRHIQHPCRLNVTILVACNKLCVHT